MRHLQNIDKSEFYLGNQDSTVVFVYILVFRVLTPYKPTLLGYRMRRVNSWILGVNVRISFAWGIVNCCTRRIW